MIYFPMGRPATPRLVYIKLKRSSYWINGSAM